MPWNTALPGSVVVICHHSTVTGLSEVAGDAVALAATDAADEAAADAVAEGEGDVLLEEHAPATNAITAAPTRSRCGTSFTIEPPSPMYRAVRDRRSDPTAL